MHLNDHEILDGAVISLQFRRSLQKTCWKDSAQAPFQIGQILVRPGSKKSIFQTSFLGVLSVAIHSNEVAKGQIARNIIKIGLIGP